MRDQPWRRLHWQVLRPSDEAAAANEAGPTITFMGANINAGRKMHKTCLRWVNNATTATAKAQSQPAPDASGWTCSCGYKGQYRNSARVRKT